VKDSTFTMRISAEVKDQLDRAAAAEGLSLAKFVEEAALVRAARTRR
jgi:uncharacterized protein (DUF1778 family)